MAKAKADEKAIRERLERKFPEDSPEKIEKRVAKATEPTVKVRAIEPLIRFDGPAVRDGQVVDLPVSDARGLVAAGQVEEIEEKAS